MAFLSTVSINATGIQQVPISRFLDTNGDGTGTKNAVGNYASPTEFYIQPAAGTIYRIARMIVTIEDTTGFTATEYGNTGGALANGVTVQTKNDSGAITDWTDQQPVTVNSEWGKMCYDVDLKSWGAGNEILVARWTFERSGQQIRLDGDDANNERFVVSLNDDLTGLIQHYFLVQGYSESSST